MDNPTTAEIQPFYQKERNLHSNRIIDSRQEFTLLEKKIIYCIINQLDAGLDMTQKDLFGDIYFKIPVSTFGIDYSFKALKASIEKITTRNIKGGDNKKEHAWSMTPIPWAEVKNGSVQVKLQKEAVPYFVDLKLRGYTAYQLDVALSLTSVYSQRLFELLSRFKDTGEWYVDIDRFKFLLGIDKNKVFNGASANGNLKVKILDPAMKELAEKTDIVFAYDLKKEGRKFVRIIFQIATKKLIRYVESENAKAGADQLLKDLGEGTQGQQWEFVYAVLPDYDLTKEQKRRIIAEPELTTKFVRIHGEIKAGKEIRETPTKYMAWHLFVKKD
jgi:plasmid replication initiation protein